MSCHLWLNSLPYTFDSYPGYDDLDKDDNPKQSHPSRNKEFDFVRLTSKRVHFDGKVALIKPWAAPLSSYKMDDSSQKSSFKGNISNLNSAKNVSADRVLGIPEPNTINRRPMNLEQLQDPGCCCCPSSPINRQQGKIRIVNNRHSTNVNQLLEASKLPPASHQQCPQAKGTDQATSPIYIPEENSSTFHPNLQQTNLPAKAQTINLVLNF